MRVQEFLQYCVSTGDHGVSVFNNVREDKDDLLLSERFMGQPKCRQRTVVWKWMRKRSTPKHTHSSWLKSASESYKTFQATRWNYSLLLVKAIIAAIKSKDAEHVFLRYLFPLRGEKIFMRAIRLCETNESDIHTLGGANIPLANTWRSSKQRLSWILRRIKQACWSICPLNSIRVFFFFFLIY